MTSRRKPVTKIQFADADALVAGIENVPAIVKPPADSGTAIEIIDRIYEQLVFLREERNYDYSKLADYLESGLQLELTAETVRKYMNRVKEKRQSQKSKGTQRVLPKVVEMARPAPVLEPPVIETPVAHLEVPIPPAIADTTPPVPQPKVPLRSGEWSHTELRKHFNKY
jgi:hypothetical protein